MVFRLHSFWLSKPASCYKRLQKGLAACIIEISGNLMLRTLVFLLHVVVILDLSMHHFDWWYHLLVILMVTIVMCSTICRFFFLSSYFNNLLENAISDCKEAMASLILGKTCFYMHSQFIWMGTFSYYISEISNNAIKHHEWYGCSIHRSGRF